MNHHSSAAEFGRLLRGRRSPWFHATTADAVDTEPKRLGEELLYTQSNARCTLGHSPRGELRFVALPTVNYPIPVNVSEDTGEIDYYPGTYYQTDMVLYAGNLRYRLETEEGERLPGIAEAENETAYRDDFLPVTSYTSGGLEVTVVSLAPVAPEADMAALAPAPLPGPAGALFLMHVKNRSATPFRGRAVLAADDVIVDHYRFIDKPFPTGMPVPDRHIRQQTRMLTSPIGCVGIHMHGGTWRDMECSLPLLLAPGEEALMETRIALSMDYHGIMPALYGLYMLESADWLRRTGAFWRERLGDLAAGAEGDPEEAAKSRDLYIRALIDNFNCLQVDPAGNLLSHWQGAPNHVCGTVWGIDIEPTAISVMQFCPELAARVLLYFISRSRPPVPACPDHSTPILVAPVLLAGRYLELTGDREFFARHGHILPRLAGIMDEVLACRHRDEWLFSTRYSSDGTVFRKYDHGTNVKVWYALDRYTFLLERLEAGDPAVWRERRDSTGEAIQRLMTAEGPFGPQFSGGTNLGEAVEDCYLPENLLYYDGEDTSSMLAPVYGVYEVTEPLWVNYHRYARSLFLGNFDPEHRVDRWFHDGGPLDGTAYVAKAAGAVTPEEMAQALEDLFLFDCDETGSIFWWPMGRNYRRGISRCSQGQGAFAWLYLEQWLGIRVDMERRELTVAPRGLPTGFRWQGARIGGAVFDLEWEESPEGSSLHVCNRNGGEWTIRAGFRPWGAGAQGTLLERTATVAPGEAASLSALNPERPERPEPVRAVEDRYLGEEGIVFGPFGLRPVTYLERGCNAILVRFLLDNNGSGPLRNIRISLDTGGSCRTQRKPFEIWIPPYQLEDGNGHELAELAPGGRYVAGIWLTPPDRIFENGSRWDRHFFALSAEEETPGLTICCHRESALEITLTVTLTAEVAGGEIRKALTFPMTFSPRETDVLSRSLN